MSKLSAFSGLLALVAIVAFAACSSDPLGPGTGSVRVSLTDAPIDLTGVTAVMVTVDEITLYATDDGESDGIPFDGPVSLPGGFTVNLLDYRDGEVVFVASGDVPVGAYKRIRMRVADASLLWDDDGDPTTPDLEETIEVPSGKVDVPVPFALSQGETFEVTLDFDAAASVQVNETSGNKQYVLRPVVTPVGAAPTS